jgi:IMP dehydrogenase
MDLDNKIIKKGITYDDVLLIPRYSDFKRDEVDLSVVIADRYKINLPVLSAPMDTVTESDMAIAMSQHGALGVIHRNLKVKDQAKMIKKAKEAKVKDPRLASLAEDDTLLIAAAVGAGSDLKDRMKALSDQGLDIVCVDSGHGHSEYILKAVKYIKKNYPELIVIAGNVATGDGALALIDAGADVLRVGVGPGSICTTRIISGMGVPQLTAVKDTVKVASDKDIPVIADGGIKQIGDMAKALGMGAHFVMLGSLLAGYDQSPGEKVKIQGKEYKTYRGMGSLNAMVKGGAERYGQDPEELREKLIPEGVEGLVEYKGDVEDYLYQIAGSLRSSFYYLGSKSVDEFHKNAKFIEISNAGRKESDVHSISVTEVGSNYTKSN